MKVIVFGGAGDMGSRAAQDLARSEGVDAVIIADRNESAAKKIAESLAGEGAKIEVAVVDAMNHDSLVDSMRGCDVAAGALGPFFIFESKLMQAALDAGVNYCSICDEWEPVENAIDAFCDKARDKGLTMITGLGASPGLTNMHVADLARKMDSVQRVRMSVYLPLLDMGGGRAAIRHGLYIMSGQSVVWRGGKRTSIKSCSEKRMIDYPRFGSIASWNMGHSEPVTIPRYFPDLEEVDFYMGFGSGASLVTQMARWGIFAGGGRADFLANAFAYVEGLFAGGKPGAGAMRIDAWGKANGKEVHLLRCGTGVMRDSTGLSLSVGALMLGKGLLTAHGGVFAPEGCLEPKTFLNLMTERGIEGFEDLEMQKGV